MATPDLKGKYALVTGASSGLGVDFARNLAARGCSLILVARREDLLRSLQQGLMGQYGVELHIITLVHLTKLFVQEMVARNFGYILHIASIGAYQPSPLYASYSAAKSFVLNFGEALNYELRKTNVHSTVLSPGITATEFLKVSGQQPTLYQRLAMMRSADVARIGIENMLKGKPSVVPGLSNPVLTWSNRLVPRRLSAAISYRLMV